MKGTAVPLGASVRWLSVCGIAAATVSALTVIGSPAGAAGTSPTFSYSGFADASGLSLRGSASVSGSSLRLTDTGGNESGAAWYNGAIDPHVSFETAVGISLHDGTTPQADGVAVVLQSSTDGTGAVGRFGEGIGYGGITPSVDVEFDTWPNSWDPDANHIAITTNGDETTSVALADPPFPLADAPFFAWVAYDAGAGQLSVYASQIAVKPSTPIVSAHVDLAGVLGTANPAYVGLTGGTGSNSEDADIQAWSFTPKPVVNSPPVFTSYPTQTVYPAANVGGTTTFQVAAYDPEGGAVSFSTTPLPTNPATTCGPAVPTPPATGAVLVCTIRTTKAKLGAAQQIVVMASDPQGQTSSVAATISGTNNPKMTTAAPGAVIPAVESVASTDRLRLDLTDDDKAPFCGPGGTRCEPGMYQWAAHYFKKGATPKLALKNVTTGDSCDSRDPKAAHVAEIKPTAASVVIGYRIAFDARCGTKSTQNYSGIVADLFMTDAAPTHTYTVSHVGGMQGTQVVSGNIDDVAELNARTCFAADLLEVLDKFSTLNDEVALYKLMNSPEFRQKLAEMVTEDLMKHATKPVSGTTSCDGSRMYRAAAAVLNAETAFAAATGQTLQLTDRLTLNGNNSVYELLVADPAALATGGPQWLPLINIKTNAEDAMLTRTMVAGLARLTT